MLLSTYDFEGQTPGAQVTASAPWSLPAGSSAPLVASATEAVHGALGGLLTADASFRQLWFTEAQNADVRVADMYLTLRTAPADNTYPVRCLEGTSAAPGAARGDVRINTNRTVTIRAGSTAVATSTAALEVGVGYRFAWHVGPAGQELRVYEGDNIDPAFTLSHGTGFASHSALVFGVVAAATVTLGMDTVRVADDWLAPAGTPLTKLPTPTGFTLVGSAGQVAAAWETVSGAATYELAVEHLNGEAWTPLDVFTGAGVSRVLAAGDGIVAGERYRGRVRALPTP